MNDLANFFFFLAAIILNCVVYMMHVYHVPTHVSLSFPLALSLFSHRLIAFGTAFLFCFSFGERITASTIAHLEFQQFHFISTFESFGREREWKLKNNGATTMKEIGD